MTKLSLEKAIFRLKSVKRDLWSTDDIFFIILISIIFFIQIKWKMIDLDRLIVSKDDVRMGKIYRFCPFKPLISVNRVNKNQSFSGL